MPAEINMAGRDRVVLDRINGRGGDIVAARLKATLAQSFTVVDRASFGAASTEEILKRLRGGDGQATPGVTTAAVLVKGNVLRHDFNHNVREVKYTQNGVPYVGYVDEGAATVEASLEVVELATTQVIAIKTLQVEQKGQTDIYQSPPSLNPEPLFNDCYSAIVQRFMRTISPYDVSIDDCLYKTSKVPENESAVGMVLAGDYGRAVKEFAAALESVKANPKIKPAQTSEIWHNLGIAHEFGGDFEQAIRCYKQAITLQAKEGFQKSLQRCVVRQRTAAELKDQTGR
jgi:tetratricopeptide (TPR) repeat protein